MTLDNNLLVITTRRTDGRRKESRQDLPARYVKSKRDGLRGIEIPPQGAPGEIPDDERRERPLRSHGRSAWRRDRQIDRIRKEQLVGY